MKKTIVILAVLSVLLIFIIPSGANPSEVVLDQQVELAVPGVFTLIDADHNQKPDQIQFAINLTASQEGHYIVIGNLEGMKGSHWVALGTTVIPFDWKPDHSKVNLLFHSDNLRKFQISGPYRVNIALKSGDWELPAQVAGFSPKYSWQQFQSVDGSTAGAINDISTAKRVVESWAQLQNIKLGNLTEASYDYDRWQLDYQDRSLNAPRGRIVRMVISPQGAINTLRINPEDAPDPRR